MTMLQVAPESQRQSIEDRVNFSGAQHANGQSHPEKFTPLRTTCGRRQARCMSLRVCFGLYAGIVLANHLSTRTTQLYDRRLDEISLDEVERIGGFAPKPLSRR